MKLLLDQQLSFRLCGMLADLYPGSTHVRLLGLDRASDHEVWQHAEANGFAIVTLDSDFRDMSALYASPPRVVWLRCGNQPTMVIERLLREHAPTILAFELDVSASCLEVF